MSRDLRHWLLVHPPDEAEQQYELGKARLRIGRGSDNQVVLSDEYVSAKHAEIVGRGGRYWVRDLGSTNGSELNGSPLVAGTAVVLEDGDVLQMGGCTLAYRVGSAEDEDSALAGPAPRGRGLVWGLLSAVLFVFVALSIVIGAAWALAPPRLTLLVLGSDARPDEVARGQPGRTDTLLTVVADRPPGGATLVSLPRDLWVGIPSFGEERINVAYALGGPETAKRAVGETLGLRVDRYLLVGLQGVRDIVDAVGGVEIEVESRVYDEAYPTDDYRTTVVDIPPGRHHMNGETALRYARTRHQDSDFGRVARQQRVLLAVRSAMLRPSNWWRAPAVLEAVRRSTRTDLEPLDIVALGLSLVASPGEPERLVVGPPMVEDLRGADGAYLLRPTPALRKSVAEALARRG